MQGIYGGHLVARHLKETEGIDTVFSLSGGHIDRIYDGFLEYGVRLIDVRHEQAAAMAAHAWSIFSGKPGICIATAGPGFTNTLTGLVNAALENAPLVLISGATAVRDWQKGALQEMEQTAMVRPFVKWAATCHDVKRVPEYISAAIRHAVSGRPGPVFLELPPDVLNVSAQENEIVPAGSGAVVYKSGPDPAAVAKAAEMINQAKKPMLLAGSGIATDQAAELLTELVEKAGIPCGLTNNGRGAVSDLNPLSLWDGGQMGLMAGMPQADLVIALGIRFNWLLLFGEGFPQACVIRADIDSSELSRNRACDVGLAGDMEMTLKALLPLVENKDRSQWLGELKESYLPLDAAEEAARTTASDPIHPARLAFQVRQAVGDDAIYIMDGGDTAYFGLTSFKAIQRAHVLAASGGLLGCLGTGLPFAMGAKAALPHKKVVVFNGDGSFGFNAMEFDTFKRHDLPILCVVNNDQAWGMIKHGQEICYGGERVIGSELGVVHYEQVAMALGGYGEFVDKDDQIIPAVQRALESGKPACINALTDPCVTSPATLLFSESLKME
ncbi:thiamine pyrophosphate protein TPP binding domain protein [Desulfatibacillum aliphaticivorans]|uniref:Thiamine pyrophosphate protein TPP binding domain protein n=1 Tax=Desulfatibacillum aliphaticivorans TaxID=218208 RepID=B8FDQ9_DESAL|nr:thiamine pyrophosphate-binding protein [Desulfatibacillum aliphaticivorans]ACL06690.1 thiamine pyrophosphate protein TPP binding domain protein [Desulfatibacillum aliphaticivorans]